MNNAIDKFFRSKLANHSLDSGVAWSRIEEGLPKKNRTILWYRAAAAFVTASLTFALWFYSSKNDSVTETVAQSFQEQPVNEEVAQNKEQLMAADESVAAKEKDIKQLAKRVIKKNKAAEPAKEKSNDINEMANLPITIATMEPNPIEPFEETHSEATKTSKPIVIVYELKEVATKIENPSNLDLSPQKKTGIKKVFEIANNMRNGDSPFGGLRQAKEEILAFNFRKENRNNK